MNVVNVTKQGPYPVSAKAIKDAVKKALKEQGIVSDSSVEVTVISDKKMGELGHAGHPVLSYPNSEIKGDFSFPPDGKLHLGEILISFDWIKAEANKTGKRLDALAIQLAEHATLHLVGVHHD